MSLQQINHLNRGALILALLTALLAGCSAVTVDRYAGSSLVLEPERFFQGKLCADGLVRNYHDEVIRRFNARIQASWDDQGVGTLDEVFQFDDKPIGTYETRVWTLMPQPQPGAYRASANDVPESALMQYAGNSLHMNYTLDYGEGDDVISLEMDDWMFLVADGVILNETRMYKWGLPVGSVILVIRQVSPDTACLPDKKANLGQLVPSSPERVWL